MISRHALLHRYYLFDALMRVAMAINGDSCLLVLKTAVFQEKQSYLLNFTDKCEDGTCRIKDEIDEEYKIKGGGCKTAVYPQE